LICPLYKTYTKYVHYICAICILRIYSLHILVVLKIKKTKQKSFIIKVITPNGKEKHYAYDACNRLLEERTIDKPNGIDRVVSYSYDKAGNVIERETGGRKEERATYQKVNYAYNYEDQAVEKTNAWEEGMRISMIRISK
jgi:hypothetical protein